MISAVDAIAQIDAGLGSGKVYSVNELRTIAGSVSAASSSPDGIVYSGSINGIEAYKMVDSVAASMGWGTVSGTERAALLSSRTFQDALTDAVHNDTGLTGQALTDAFNATLSAAGENGAADGGRSFWSQDSVEYTQSLTGRIFALTPDGRPDGIYAVDELKAALSNPDGGPINGIARSELITTAQTFGYDVARQQVNAAAASIIGTDGIAENNLNSDGSSAAIRGFELTAQGASRLGVDPRDFRPYLDAQATGGHGSLASTNQTGGELEGLSGAGTPNQTAAGLNGGTLVELNKFVEGQLKTLDTSGYAYDAAQTAAKAVEQLQNGDAAGSSQTLKDFASRLYYGLQGAEAGILLGTGAFSETGPGALIAGLVGGVAGGVAGAAYGPEAVDAIWNMSRQVLDYMTGQSGPGVAITVHPDPVVQQQVEDLRQQLLSSGVPADQANEVINLVQGEWANRSAADQNMTLSDFAHRMVDNVQDNQGAVPSTGGGPTIILEPTAPDENGDSGKDAEVFDSFRNARAEIISNPDGSSSGVAYDSSGHAVAGASITPDGTTSEAIKNQPDGGQQYTSFATNAAGSSVADLQQFAANGTQQYDEITTITAVGEVSVDISGTGAVTDLSNASISLAPGSSATIIGGADAVNAASGSTLTLTGDNNALTLAANSAASLTGIGESVFGSGAAVTLGANSSASFAGSGNTINAAQGDVIAEDNAVINVAQGASVTIVGTGDVVVAGGNDLIAVIGGGDIVSLNGAGNTAVLFGNGNADIVNGDIAGDDVALAGATTATVNGAGGGINLGAGDTLTTSNEAIYAAENTTGVTVYGSGDVVNAASGFLGTVVGGGDTVNLNGANNTAVLIGNGNADTVNGDNAGNDVALAGGTAATVNGAGGAINLSAGDTLTASNEAVYAAANTTSATVNGSGDVVNAASGFVGNVVGGGDTVNLNGVNNTAILTGNGTADTVNGDTAGNDVSLGGGTTATINGAGGAINISAGDTLTASNEAIYAAANTTSATVTGSGDVVNAASGFVGNVVGGGDTVNLNGAGNTAILTGNGTADTVNGDTAGNDVSLSGGTTATVNGAGGAINISAGDTLTASNEAIYAAANTTSVTVTGSGDIVNAASGFVGTVVGGGDTVNLNGAGNTAILTGNGTADTVNGDSAGNDVSLNGGTTATVNGAGGAINLGAGETLTASNEAIYAAANTTGVTVYGSGDIVNAASGFVGTVVGGGDTVNLNGAGNTAILTGNGTADTVNGDSAGNDVALAGGTTATVNGSGGAINLSAGDTLTASNQAIYAAENTTSATVNGSGDVINAAAGFLGTVTGGGDTVNLNGAGNTAILTGNGTADTVNGDTAGNDVSLNGGTTATVNGSGGAINISAGETLTASNEAIYAAANTTSVTIYGSGDIVNAASGFLANVVGGADTVNFSGAGNHVGLYGNGTNDIVNGVNAGSSVDLNADNTVATVHGAGGDIGVLENGDSLTASNEAVHTAGGAANESISGSGNAINAGGGFSGDVFGGSDTITFNGPGSLLELYGNSNSDTLNNVNSGVSVDIQSSSTVATASGSGGTISMLGSGGTLDVSGGSDTVNLTGANEHLELHGNGNADNVTHDVNGDDVSVYSGTTATVTGNAGAVDIVGSNATVTASSEHINITANMTGETISGSGDMITAGNGVTGAINGSNDTIHDGSHDSFTVDGDHDTATGDSTDKFEFEGGNYTGDGVSGGATETQDPDPIVLNLDGGAVQTQALATSTAFFDMQNNGEKVHTGWVTPGEGLLVYDADGSNGVSGDRDLVAGFDALKALAVQVDGTSSDTLSASDAIWSKLKVWVDTAGTADFHGNQLFTLGQLGIASINLDAANVQANNQANGNGNSIVADSSFTRSDGSHGDIAGVALAFDAGPANAAANANATIPAQLQQFISAMATYAPPGAGVLPMTADNENGLPMMLAASQH
jgi:hypothetical protein